MLTGKWIAKVVAGGIELHESVNDSKPTQVGLSNIGPPSSFIAGDTIRAGTTLPTPTAGYLSLAEATSTTTPSRITNAATGVETDSTATVKTIVGMIRRVAGTGYQDAAANRFVASYFNPREKPCQKTTASDRTTASGSFGEVNTDIRCNFVYISGANSYASSLGDSPRPVRYTATITSSNDTGGGGCEYAVAFDGTTPETELARFTNPTAVTTGQHTLTISGAKLGLTETNHFITLLVRNKTGGICTTYADSTFLTAFPWQ